MGCSIIKIKYLPGLGLAYALHPVHNAQRVVFSMSERWWSAVDRDVEYIKRWDKEFGSTWTRSVEDRYG